MILIMIPLLHDVADQDQEHDQDHEQECSFVRDGEEVNEQRNTIPGPEWMFAIRKNFDLAEEAREQRMQTGTREKVFVIAFEQMPGNDAPIMEVRQKFQVRNGEESATPDNPCDFAGESLGIFRVLEDFDANGGIEFAVCDWQSSSGEIDFAKGQLATTENAAAIVVRFEAEPFVTGSDQGRAIRACATTDIDDRRARGQIGAEQIRDFDARFFDRRTGAVNIFAVKEGFVRRRDNVTVRAFAQARGNHAHLLVCNNVGKSDTQNGIVRFGITGRNPAEHAKARPSIVRTRKKNSRLGATNFAEKRA